MALRILAERDLFLFLAGESPRCQLRLRACISRRPSCQLRLEQKRRWLLFVNADIYASPSHAVRQPNERIRDFGEV